jgi:mycothiol system anti-sigma-R factor
VNHDDGQVRRMNCDESFELLYRYLDSDMDGMTLRDIEVHLKICRPCWDRFAFERKLKERLRSSCHKETCSNALRQRIQSLLEKY